MEKKVLMRICTKIVAETDLYVTDSEMQNLIDWVCVSGQIKENNNRIRELTGEYKQIEPDCREEMREKLERMKEVCKERDSLFEQQNGCSESYFFNHILKYNGVYSEAVCD